MDEIKVAVEYEPQYCLENPQYTKSWRYTFSDFGGFFACNEPKRAAKTMCFKEFLYRIWPVQSGLKHYVRMEVRAELRLAQPAQVGFINKKVYSKAYVVMYLRS